MDKLDNKIYSLGQYLFDIENYISLNVMCDEKFPVHIWKLMFEHGGMNILFNSSDSKSVKLKIFKGDDLIDGQYGASFTICELEYYKYYNRYVKFNDDVIGIIKSYRRECKIDKLL